MFTEGRRRPVVRDMESIGVFEDLVVEGAEVIGPAMLA